MTPARLLWRSAWLGLVLSAACSRGPEPGALAGWNVLLITIDTLRADHVGYSGYDGADTPTLDGLAEEGIAFEEAVSAAPVTLPSHATILTGRYPPAHGALDNGFYSLPADVPTLTVALKDAGYETHAVVGAYVLHGQYGLDRGFDDYDDRFRRHRAESEQNRERRAEEVADRALDWIDARSGDSPFFLWLHFYDPHAPYEPPDPFRMRFATRPYDGEIAYTDRQIRRVLEGLREAGVRERTLVVVTADHGEGFGDGGEKTHGILLRPTTLNVPLLIHAPAALPTAVRVPGLVSTADVTPTILELVGVEALPGANGSSLLPAVRAGRAEGRGAYSETRLPVDQFGWAMLNGFRTEEWAWVRGPIPELYDLRTDPAQSHSLHEELPERARELDAEVARVLGQAKDVSPTTLSGEELEALRALGYLVGTEASTDGEGADPKERIELWNRINHLRFLLPEKRFAEVERGLREVLEQDPGNREARLLYAQALVGTGKSEEGIREFRSLMERGVFLGRGGVLFARTLAEAGRPEEAEAVLRGFMESEPKFAEHPYNLGVLLMGQQRWVDAQEALERAHRLNPEAVHILANLAIVASHTAETPEDEERAIALVNRAIEGGESDLPRLAKLRVLRRFGRTEEADSAAADLTARTVLHDVTREEVEEVLRGAE